jgi:hypothetical protein
MVQARKRQIYGRPSRKVEFQDTIDMFELRYAEIRDRIGIDDGDTPRDINKVW